MHKNTGQAAGSAKLGGKLEGEMKDLNGEMRVSNKRVATIDGTVQEMLAVFGRFK